MTGAWKVPRLPGKNLECEIVFVRDGNRASILSEANLLYHVSDEWWACSTPIVTTNPHRGGPFLLEPGKHSGLDEDPSKLAGKHPLHQAINLAVHLGFSRIHLMTPEPEPRLRRALDSLVRPLRHRRVLVTGCAPFAEE